MVAVRYNNPAICVFFLQDLDSGDLSDRFANAIATLDRADCADDGRR